MDLGEASADHLTHDHRLIRLCSEKCLARMRVEPAVARLARERIDRVLIDEQIPGYPRVTCVVNGTRLGKVAEDPETGGYREYLLHTRLIRSCCKLIPPATKDCCAKKKP